MKQRQGKSKIEVNKQALASLTWK